MSDAEMIREWLADATSVLGAIDADAVAAATEALVEVRGRGATIFAAGNGGSASTASHFALDLQKAARPDGRGTRAIALNDNIGLITAWSNDEEFARAVVEQLRVLAQPGDALVLFSVSGSSPNLVAAAEWARGHEVTTIGLLGRDGGRLRELVDHAVVVPSHDYGWVESAHLVLEHVLTYSLRRIPAEVGGSRNGGERGHR